MSVNNEAGAARQFVASGEAFSTGWIKGTKVFQAVYSVFFVAFVGFAALAMFRTSKGMHVHVPRYTGLIFMAVLLVAGVVHRRLHVLAVTAKVRPHRQRRCAHRRFPRRRLLAR
jgi:hypothetical protein